MVLTENNHREVVKIAVHEQQGANRRLNLRGYILEQAVSE